MKIYNFDRDSRELVDVDEAEPDPLTPGEYLVPANATTVTPPRISAFETAVFDPESQIWHVVDVSYRMGDNVLREVSRRLAEVGPLFDAYSDLAALGELDEDGLAYLQSVRIYRVNLRQVHKQPGFPLHVVMPQLESVRAVPHDPLRPDIDRSADHAAG